MRQLSLTLHQRGNKNPVYARKSGSSLGNKTSLSGFAWVTRLAQYPIYRVGRTGATKTYREHIPGSNATNRVMIPLDVTILLTGLLNRLIVARFPRLG
jgi:hypothetical protein